MVTKLLFLLDLRILFIICAVCKTFFLEICSVENDDKLADRTLLSPRLILDLLDILPRTTYLKFNGDSYQQTDEAAIGGPTSAIVSEIYMQSCIRDNSHHNSRSPSQSLGTPCR